MLIATRYVYRLRKQKRDDRSRRLGYFHALSTPETRSTRHTRQASDNIELLRSEEFTGGDPQDLEDVVLDIRPRSYMPVSTYDRDLPPVPVVGSPPSLSETTSGRRIRALPPRPTTASPVVARAPKRPQEDVVRPERLPNPHDPDSEDEHLYTSEVSTTAHSALMDHAAYMESVFSRPNLSQRSLR